MVNQIIQTDTQSFYIFSVDYLIDMDDKLIKFNHGDIIVAKNYYSFVGMSDDIHQTQIGKYKYIVVPVMGHDSSNHTTSGYCLTGDVPTFYLYRKRGLQKKYLEIQILNNVDVFNESDLIELNLNIEPWQVNDIHLVNFDRIEYEVSSGQDFKLQDLPKNNVSMISNMKSEFTKSKELRIIK